MSNENAMLSSPIELMKNFRI